MAHIRILFASIAVLVGFVIHAQSPYGYAGDSSGMLKPEALDIGRIKGAIVIGVDSDSIVSMLNIDFRTGLVSRLTEDGKIIAVDTIPDIRKAFSSQDPLAILNPGDSPYIFCGGNPINRVDPSGMTTYNVDGQQHVIDDGDDDLYMNVESSHFEQLERMFSMGCLGNYGQFRDALSKALGFTVKRKAPFPEEGFRIFEARPGEESYSDWKMSDGMADGLLGLIGTGAGVGGNAVDALWEQRNNFALGSNGRIYTRNKATNRIFEGNQYVKVIRFSDLKFLRHLKNTCKYLSIACNGWELTSAYIADGNNFGYITGMTASEIAGEWGGATIGQSLGGMVGGGLGGPYGAVAGGFIGSVLGSVGGGKAAKEVYIIIMAQ